MYKTLIRPAMIFIPFTLGLFFPEAAAFQWTIRWALIIMLFLSCLQIRFTHLKPKAFHWRLLLVNLLTGVAGYWILRAFGDRYITLAQATFFIGIAPTATAAPVIMKFLNGRVGYVLTGFVISNIAVSLSMLFLLPMITGTFTISFLSKIGYDLLLVMGLPISVALVLRMFYPKIKDWASKTNDFSFSLWSFMLFICAAIARNHFMKNPDESIMLVLQIAFASLVICAFNYTFGYLTGPKYAKRECSQMLGQKNTTFTLFFAITYAVNPIVALGPIFYILWHNCWNAYQLFSYDRRKISRKRKLFKSKL